MAELKMLHIDFNTLAYGRAIDVIPSQDPNINLRIYLPVSNWINRKGTDIQRAYQHVRVKRRDETGAFAFRFKNPQDKSIQDVAVDGTGVIAFDGLKPKDLDGMTTHILVDVLKQQHVRSVSNMTPEQIMQVFDWVYRTQHARVFLASTQVEAREHWHRWHTPNDTILYGGFLPKLIRSAAIGYRGPVTFNTGNGQPAVFRDGAYAVFPGISAGDLALAGKKGVFALNAAPQFVKPDDLRVRHTLPDNTRIPAPQYRPWSRHGKIAP